MPDYEFILFAHSIALNAEQDHVSAFLRHAALLLRTDGRTNVLRALLKTEQDPGPDFLPLANVLSALYPRQSEEKRLLDALLLAVPK